MDVTLILVKRRQVFLGCKNDSRALCLAARVGGVISNVDEIRRAADLGDAFAQARMAWLSEVEDQEECFQWAGKSAAQGERDGFFEFGGCHEHGVGCEKDAKRAAAELGDVHAMIYAGELFHKHDLQRFIWRGRAAASGEHVYFWNEMSVEIRGRTCKCRFCHRTSSERRH
jgi:hypothetical protein